MYITLLLCKLAEVVYPAYASFKAIKTDDKSDDTQWLTYWIVYASYSTVEWCVPLHIVPFYVNVKLLFVLWLISPQTCGAKKIYDKLVAPWLDSQSATIDPLYESSVKALQSKTLVWVAGIMEEHGPVIGEQAMRVAIQHVNNALKCSDD